MTRRSDAELLRKLERARLLLRVNEQGMSTAAEMARSRLEALRLSSSAGGRETLENTRPNLLALLDATGPDPLLAEAAWLTERAEAGATEIDRISRQLARLRSDAADRNLVCIAISSGSCQCARCDEDGQTQALLGPGHKFFIVAREHIVEAYMAFSSRPSRTPIVLRPRRNGLTPHDWGDRRDEQLRLLLGIVSVAEIRPRGRPRSGLRTDKIRAQVDVLRSAGMTIEAACNALAEELSYSASSIRRVYYRR